MPTYYLVRHKEVGCFVDADINLGVRFQGKNNDLLPARFISKEAAGQFITTFCSIFKVPTSHLSIEPYGERWQRLALKNWAYSACSDLKDQSLSRHLLS